MTAQESAPRPRRKRRVLRIFLWLLGIAVTLLLVAGIGLWMYLRASLPEYSGTVTVVRLQQPVEIVRDSAGIPHIYAQNEADALFGLGYVHAQDRLWQMEWQRRIARGTLAEAVGEDALSTDRFLRTLGVYRAAQSAYASLDPDTKTLVDAYVDGINNFLATHSGADLPPEFTLVGVTPDPWVGADVLGWAKMMAWDLGGNWSNELLRTDLIATVGEERANALMLRYPEDGVTITSAALTDGPVRELLALNQNLQQELGMGLGIIGGTGSNNWVVGPDKSATGKPLLANDPHLGLRTPSIWYLAALQGGSIDVVGASIPGLPGILSGHNQRIAWGVTNLGPDVQDLYREHLDATGMQAEFQGGYEPLTIITETISIKDQAPETLTVRISRHGPLISDALNANDPEVNREALAFRWTALGETDTTVKAFIDINRAQNWDEFKQAFRAYVAPSQNFVYADVDGNIGYFGPGNIPIRASGDGDLPAEGWTGDQEWTGFVPFEELPQAFNPPAGFIATANNKPVSASYPYFLGNDWAAPYRATRITQMLEAKPKVSMDDMRAIQYDQHSLFAEALLPELLAITEPADDQQRAALQMLGAWDRTASSDSSAAAIFEAWAYYLTPALVGDELGGELLGTYGSKSSFRDQFLVRTLADPQSAWCDDVTTSTPETCAATANNALTVALKDLAERTGKSDMAQWRWDAVHIAFLPHSPLDAVNPLRGFFSQAIPNGGDGSTVNVAAINSDQPFAQTSGPALRTMQEVGNWEQTQFIITPGEAGHPLSNSYANWLELWQRGEYVTLPQSRASAENGALGTLRLEPGVSQ